MARCVPLAGRREARPDAERAKYADRALEVLREAVRHGYADVERLRTEPALEPLRPRADFQALLREVESGRVPARP